MWLKIIDRLELAMEFTIEILAIKPPSQRGPPTIEEVRFAVDSPLEESGFEPLVPLTPKRGRCRFASK
jgi:hypothetical protein